MPLAVLFLLFTSLLAIFADGFLWLGALSRGTAIISAILAGLVIIALRKPLGLALAPLSSTPKKPWKGILSFIATSSIAVLLLWIILKHPIITSVRSPWPALPGIVLVLGALLFLSGIIMKRAGRLSSTSWLLIAFPYLALLPLIFPLGYGFDPLLHQAAEQSIAQNGLINPLPILYGAYYSLVVSLHFLTGIAIPLLNNFLVPALAAIILPTLLEILVPPDESAVSKISLFILPIAFLTISTPFGYALLLFIAVAMLSARAKQQDFILIGLLSICAFLAHALAGIGALAIFFASLFKRPKDRLTFAFFFPLLIPVLMTGKAVAEGKALQYAMHPDRLFSWLPVFPNITNLLTEDLAYLSALLIGLVYLALVARGILHCHTLTGVCEDKTVNDISAQDRGYGLLAVATSLFITALILRAFEWPDVISYEQNDFSERLLFMALLTLSPFAVQALAKLASGLKKTGGLVLLGNIVLITILATAHWYALYPRQDRHEISKGFNTSLADYNTAETIQADARGKPYIVLAPQNISAAFINRFGFPKKLIASKQGEILPYPIPTGGPLYPFYEKFAVDPQLLFIKQARELTKQQLIYVALPDFWTNSEINRRVISSFASGSWRVDNQVSVFKFE